MTATIRVKRNRGSIRRSWLIVAASVLACRLARPPADPVTSTPSSASVEVDEARPTTAVTPGPGSNPPSEPNDVGADRTCRLQPGQRTETLIVNGYKRSFELWIGPQAQPGAPLLLLWHGWGGEPSDVLAMAEPELYWADAIVVAPRGLPRSFEIFGDRVANGWQIDSGDLSDRDLALFDAIITRMRGDYCVDPHRIYASGFSNGGYFTNLLGCVRGTVLAAIVPAGGGGPWSPCQGEVAVSIVHGRNDNTVAFTEAVSSAEIWTRVNACPAIPVPPAEGCVRSECKNGPLEFCAFGGAHEWRIRWVDPVLPSRL